MFILCFYRVFSIQMNVIYYGLHVECSFFLSQIVHLLVAVTNLKLQKQYTIWVTNPR